MKPLFLLPLNKLRNRKPGIFPLFSTYFVLIARVSLMKSAEVHFMFCFLICKSRVLKMDFVLPLVQIFTVPIRKKKWKFKASWLLFGFKWIAFSLTLSTDHRKISYPTIIVFMNCRKILSNLLKPSNWERSLTEKCIFLQTCVTQWSKQK